MLVGLVRGRCGSDENSADSPPMDSDGAREVLVAIVTARTSHTASVPAAAIISSMQLVS